MNWQYVSLDEVYAIHQAVVKLSKTKASVRDFALLHSAVERARATYGGRDLYPNVFLKAAALLHSLCLNHPFTDGNKRTSWLSSKRFLYINGYHLKANIKEAVDFMLWVDNSQPSVEKIAPWLKKHTTKKMSRGAGN